MLGGCLYTVSIVYTPTNCATFCNPIGVIESFSVRSSAQPLSFGKREYLESGLLFSDFINTKRNAAESDQYICWSRH